MKFLAGICLVIAAIVFCPYVSAQEKIDSFDVDIVAHKDGSMTVTENIVYDFGEDSRHGIFRTIPLVSKVGDLFRVIEIDFEKTFRDGKNEDYEVDLQSKETEIKIGNADKTVNGQHNYIIIYTVKNGIGSNFETHDEIYWNVTGNDWEIPIEKASLKIRTDFGVNSLESKCFTGPQSLKFQNCEVKGDAIFTTQELDSYQGLTTVTKFPVNTFPKSELTTSEPVFDPDFLALLKFYIPILVILNFVLAPLIFVKYLKNKRRGLGKVSVSFDIPKDLSPAEAGIIDNAKLEKNDVIATIFDLAIRKYIKIEEVKIIKTLRPDSVDYKIVKLKESVGLNAFEEKLYSRLFQSGDEIKLGDLKTDFYSTFASLETKAFNLLVSKKMYNKNPKNQKAGLMTAGIVGLSFGNIILGPLLMWLSRVLNGRTEKGDKADHQVEGLKIFLKAMSRHHKFQSANLITVEKYIPYAIALGLQNEFMAQLKIIDPNYSPSWYSGNHVFMHSYSGMYSSMNSITTSAPSSSSGFSGGSSGGGGGGGGGGSW